jgi:hypothetical protein
VVWCVCVCGGVLLSVDASVLQVTGEASVVRGRCCFGSWAVGRIPAP